VANVVQIDRDKMAESDPIIIPLTRQTDLARMAKVAAGDRLVMKSVFEEFSGPLNSFVRNWLANPHDASDVVSEVMIEVWKNAARYEGRSALKSWIFSIARNKSIDLNRKGARISYTDQVPDSADLSRDAVEHLAASQNANVIKQALEMLSPPHRRAIHLAFFEDMTYAQIADIEACPVGTIKTRILHAKKRLMREVVKLGRN